MNAEVQKLEVPQGDEIREMLRHKVVQFYLLQEPTQFVSIEDNRSLALKANDIITTHLTQDHIPVLEMRLSLPLSEVNNDELQPTTQFIALYTELINRTNCLLEVNKYSEKLNFEANFVSKDEIFSQINIKKTENDQMQMEFNGTTLDLPNEPVFPRIDNEMSLEQYTRLFMRHFASFDRFYYQDKNVQPEYVREEEAVNYFVGFVHNFLELKYTLLKKHLLEKAEVAEIIDEGLQWKDMSKAKMADPILNTFRNKELHPDERTKLLEIISDPETAFRELFPNSDIKNLHMLKNYTYMYRMPTLETALNIGDILLIARQRLIESIKSNLDFYPILQRADHLTADNLSSEINKFRYKQRRAEFFTGKSGPYYGTAPKQSLNGIEEMVQGLRPIFSNIFLGGDILGTLIRYKQQMKTLLMEILAKNGNNPDDPEFISASQNITETQPFYHVVFAPFRAHLAISGSTNGIIDLIHIRLLIGPEELAGTELDPIRAQFNQKTQKFDFANPITYITS